MNVSPRKAETVSLIALILSLVFFAFSLIFGAYVRILAMYMLSWQFLAGAFIWLVLLIQFHQRKLAEQEKLDMAQLSKSESQDTIFSGGADRMAMLAVQQKRLVFFEKWFIPIASVLLAVYEILIGLALFKVVSDPIKSAMWGNFQDPLLGGVLIAGVSFVCFLFSRYATGMSSEIAWKPLRAGGGYLLLTAVFGFFLALSLGLAQFKYGQGLFILNYVLPWVLVVLGVEIVLNSILDIYRPRVSGQYSRATFDSRILGVFNEPGGILHTVAHTIDYQFGFQVSQTWFYKLLEKAIIPLLLFAAVVLYLLSSIVVVGPGQAAVIEYFGNPVRDEGSGLHFKWPWPIQTVYLYPTKEIQQISVGYIESEADKGKKTYFWGEKHYQEEYNLLVAVDTEEQEEQGAVPVSIVQASVPIQYRIRDNELRKYLYRHREARDMLEAICYRELTRFAVSASIEFDEPGGVTDSKSLLGAGRIAAARELKRRIQAAVDSFEVGDGSEPGLGIEIVFLGLQGVHPPAEVAKEYEQVVAAVQEKQATVLNAQAQKNRILTELGGTIAEVDALYELAIAHERSKEQGDAASEQLGQQLQTALSDARGKIFKTLRTAKGDAFVRVNAAKGDGLRFAGQLQGYRASPEIYLKLQRLIMLEEALKDIRKFVVVAEENDAQVYIVDLQEKLTTSIYDIFPDMEDGR